MYTKDYTPEHPLLKKGEEYFYSGDVAKALHCLNSVVEEADKKGDPYLKVYTLSNMSLVHASYGNRDEALGALIEAQRISYKLGVKAIEAKIELRHIWILYKLGSLRDACVRMNRYLTIPEYSQDTFNRVLTIYMLGLAYLDIGQDDYALFCFNRGLAEATDAQTQTLVSHMHYGIAKVHCTSVWRRRTESVLRGAQSPHKKIDDCKDLQALAQGRAALADATRTLLDNKLIEQYVNLEAGKLSALQGNNADACIAFTSYIQWAVGVNDKYQERRAKTECGAYCLMRNQPEKALVYLGFADFEPKGDKELQLLADRHRFASHAHEMLGEFDSALAHHKLHEQFRVQLANAAISPVTRPYFAQASGVAPALSATEPLALASALPHVLDKAMRYIKEHLAEPISIEHVARHLGVSTRMLQSLFQTHLGTGPKKHIDDLRISLARQALLSADAKISVSDIAASCGYTRMGSFIKTYKERYGELPSRTVGMRPDAATRRKPALPIQSQ